MNQPDELSSRFLQPNKTPLYEAQPTCELWEIGLECVSSPEDEFDVVVCPVDKTTVAFIEKAHLTREWESSTSTGVEHLHLRRWSSDRSCVSAESHVLMTRKIFKSNSNLFFLYLSGKSTSAS